ncbi:MAG TPA: hypothetical protein VGM90_05960 [Kofleriaceae bacterium]|jgi:hypothetical protein
MSEASTTDKTHGVLPKVTFFAIDIVDRSQSTAIAVLDDARREIRSAVDHGIDFAEKLTTGAFRFAKHVVTRVDDAAGDVLGRANHAFGSTLAVARETTKTAADLAVKNTPRA